jgi:hypothetical protein
MSEADENKSGKALGLGTNFTSNKAERSAELVGKTLSFELDNGQRHSLKFITVDKLLWSGSERDLACEERYEAQKAADGLFLIAFQHHDDDFSSTSVIADLQGGGIVFVRSVVGEVSPLQTGVEPSVSQTVVPGLISGHGHAGTKIGQTADLFGRRAMWIYSEDDVYEHIYLNADWYAWHCLKGEEYPKADIDPCKTFKLRDDIYLLTFSEKVMVMAAAMVLNFEMLRSFCAAIGKDPSTGELTHFAFGAHGKILSQTDYPVPLAG